MFNQIKSSISLISGETFKSINQVLSEKTRFKNFFQKFLTSNIFFRNGPSLLGNEVDLKIYKSYICAKFQDNWIIFLLLSCDNENANFFQNNFFLNNK